MRAKSPTISVLMPVFNCAPYIDQSVASILRQTFTDFEFLIVDDASTDDTWPRLQSYHDSRIRLLRNPENKGLASSLNDLLHIARGEFVARMDGDDMCDLERLELQLQHMRQHPECGVVSSSFLWTDADGRDVLFFPQPQDDTEIKRRVLVSCDGLVHAGALARKSLLDDVGGYRPTIGIAEDNDLWLRLENRCGFHNLPRALYRWRQHGNSSGSRGKEQNAALAMVRMYAIERKYYGEDSLDYYDSRDLRELKKGRILPPRLGRPAIQRRVLSELCGILIMAGRPGDALAAAGVSLRCWPLCWAGYSMVARIIASPRTYLRTYRIIRNAVGRAAYAVLRLNKGSSALL